MLKKKNKKRENRVSIITKRDEYMYTYNPFLSSSPCSISVNVQLQSPLLVKSFRFVLIEMEMVNVRYYVLGSFRLLTD